MDVVSVLVDGKAAVDGLLVEHGLSFLLEFDGRKVLFDTGQGGALKPNAASMGVDLTKLDAIILSHGHYDHTGGLPHCPREVPVYCHPSITGPHFSIHEGTAPRDISMPAAAREAFASSPVHAVEAPTTLFGRLTLSGSIPRVNLWEDAGGPFFLDPEGRRKDVVEDDMAIWLDTPSGLIVCLGCCHSGLINTLSYVERVSSGRPIRAVVGGMHLLHAGEERLSQTVGALLGSFSIGGLRPCHCSGDAAVERLRADLGPMVEPVKAGTRMEFP